MSTSGRALRPDIQALRALAVTLVVAYHAHFLGFGGGYVGVDVFYVVSGFLITGQLLRELGETGRIRLGAFFARRARRLIPAASVVLLVTIAAAAVFLSPLRLPQLGGDAAAAALYVSNLRFAQAQTDYLHVGDAPSPFLHFWSLAVEEQFYLLWPALLLLLLRRRDDQVRSPLRCAAVAIGVVFAVSLASSVFLTPRYANWAFYLSPVRAWEFAAGAAVAVAAGLLARRGAVFATLTALTGVTLIVIADLRFDDATAFPGVAALVPVAGTALFLAGGAAGANPLNRIWSAAPLQRLGKLSYSLYLWHWPMLVMPAEALGRPLTLVENAAAVLASIVAAEITMRLVEDPARRSTLLRGSIKGVGFGLAMSLVTAWGVVAVPDVVTTVTFDGNGSVTAASVVDFDGGAVPADLTPALLDAATDAPDSQDDGCQTETARSGYCLYGDPDAETTIALYGDSHAGQWLPALQRLAREHGWNVLAMVKSGCPAPSVSVWKFDSRSPYTACDEWRLHAFERIVDADPDLIVVSGLQSYLPKNGATGRPALDWWAEGWQTTLARLTPVAPTMVLADTPHPSQDIPACLAENLDNAGACAVPTEVGFAQDRRATDEVTVTSAGAHFVSLDDDICDEQMCSAVRGNLLVFRDDSHLSTPFAESLAPQLAAQMRLVLPALPW
ncbi:peptidoglycan/LPS O-acetylase OafA/YrhL [Geodermatophilus normandii]|uniref:Peptidoglycan/LPS O-acetylase OafA/YrhL n=1 Tax=Geodermatophilus normandii TaxID=1137989 RepID=A0A317QDC4_9ACTN|nr:acyltransferase family protein [Geodermatophilus normandii]PWW21332.1 peptidoglycan/LPS O-acetylase OafA/YrhL [Geodermatophilus normandii]